MKTVTITELRRNIFQLIDEALATGEPIVINRKGRRVVLRGETMSPKFAGVAEEDRARLWDKFWAEPSEIKEDLSIQDIAEAGAAYWQVDEEPEPDQ